MFPMRMKHRTNSPFPSLQKIKLMPVAGDHYIGAEILLPRGDQMTRGHVVARSQNINGNIMSRSHTNPTFDTCMYQVELSRGKVTELTANVIVESM